MLTIHSPRLPNKSSLGSKNADKARELPFNPSDYSNPLIFGSGYSPLPAAISAAVSSGTWTLTRSSQRLGRSDERGMGAMGGLGDGERVFVEPTQGPSSKSSADARVVISADSQYSCGHSGEA